MANQAKGDKTQNLLWEAIAKRGVGMLGLTKSGLHAQPMIAFVERRGKRLWFIAHADTDLVRTIGEGGPCMFVMQDDELLVSVAGELSISQDSWRISRRWNAKVDAWLPVGPSDPRLVLLRLVCIDAELWMSGVGLMKFTWEIAWSGPYPRDFERDGLSRAMLH